jgi:hypothetical protein
MRPNWPLRILAICLFPFLISQIGCVSAPPVKVLTITEQIEVDTKAAQNFANSFKAQIHPFAYPEGEKYLAHVAARISKIEIGFPGQTHVMIHDDRGNPALSRFFSFPGTLISVPFTFLKTVEYENELAAAISFELANVINRHLAKKIDSGAKPILTGNNSAFDLDRIERSQSIGLGTKLLYLSGYDSRGMASIFQHYGAFYPNQGLALSKKEVEFNLREAQQAKSEYMPSLNPTVRSGEFIRMKRGLKRL